MSYFEFIDRIKRTDYLIRSQATGTATEMAGKLGVCRRTVFEYIDHIKEKGAEVHFDKKKKTFFYKNNFVLIF